MKTLIPGHFPKTRMRRNRLFDWTRSMVAENNLTPNDFILPIFVGIGEGRNEQIPSMPGVNRISVDLLDDVVGRAQEAGIPAIVIFPEIEAEKKTPDAREALNPDNLVCQSIKKVTQNYPKMGIICDAALDPFNSDGHDGILQEGIILNDETVDILCKQSVIQAMAGCHIIAP